MTTTDALRQILASARRRKVRQFRCGVSNANGCQRLRVYEARFGAVESDNPARYNLAMVLGTTVGDWLESLGRTIGLQTQIPVRISESPPVAGTADIGQRIADAWLWIADIKFVGGNTWRAVQKEPKHDHRTQVHTYAAALGAPLAAVWYVRNDPKGEDIAFVVHEEDTDPACRESVIGFWREVEEHKADGTVPPPIAAFRDAFECKHCPYRAMCEGEDD